MVTIAQQGKQIEKEGTLMLKIWKSYLWKREKVARCFAFQIDEKPLTQGNEDGVCLILIQQR